tara:strand:- start:59 stop:481 length:423 start_codon:yes stop_codon:yes gene_type:complete
MALKTTSLISDESVTASNLKTTNTATAGDAVATDGAGNLVFKTLHGAQPTVTYKNADFTITAGENVQVDTRANPVNITLPANPNVGDAVRISDGGGNFASLNVTVLRNGNTIMDLGDDLLVDYNNASFGLSYNGSTWRIF